LKNTKDDILLQAACIYSTLIPLKGVLKMVQVLVRFNNLDQALKALKKKMQREGIFRVMKVKRFHEKPSEARVRKAAEAKRRKRKIDRKRSW